MRLIPFKHRVIIVNGSRQISLFEFSWYRGELKLLSKKSYSEFEEFVLDQKKQRNSDFSLVFLDDQLILKSNLEFESLELAIPGMQSDDVYFEFNPDTRDGIFIRREVIEKLIISFREHGFLVSDFRLGVLSIQRYVRLIANNQFTIFGFRFEGGRLIKDNASVEISVDNDLTFNDEKVDASSLLAYCVASDFLLKFDTSSNGSELINRNLAERSLNNLANRILRYGLLVLILLILSGTFIEKKMISQIQLFETEQQQYQVFYGNYQKKRAQVLKLLNAQNDLGILRNHKFSNMLYEIGRTCEDGINLEEINFQPISELLNNDEMEVAVSTISLNISISEVNQIADWEERVQALSFVRDVKILKIAGDKSSSRSDEQLLTANIHFYD